MDELSPKARALLALVEDGHEPPVGASERVWEAVSTDIVAGASLGGAPIASRMGLRSSGASGFMGKVIWALLIAGLGIGASLVSTSKPDARTRVAASSATTTLESPESLVRSAQPVERAPAAPSSEARQARLESTPRPAQRGRARADTLLQEVAGLRAASDLLADTQPDAALALLRAQEKRFSPGILREEREALILLARCALDAPPVVASARAFLARTPSAVLRGRVERACKLTGEEP